MNNIIKYILSEEDSGIRIDRWLRRKFQNLPQSFIQKKIRKGLIRLNTKITKANTLLKKKDLIEIRDYDNKIYSPKKIKINKLVSKKNINKFKSSIIYENEDYLISNKWHDISTQGTIKNKNSINDLIKNLSDKMNLVHRLDKDTTGALIIAKNYKATRIFAKLFRERNVKKVYYALCLGMPKKNKGLIKILIQKDIQKKLKYSNIRQESLTHYEVVEKKHGLSSIIFFPLTGRKHQIRIVAKKLNCPIIGDKLYGKFQYQNENIKINNFLMLHALSVSFKYNNKTQKHFVNFSDKMFNYLKKLNFRFINYKDLKKYI